MIRSICTVATLALLAACGDGQPLFDVAPPETGTGTTDPTPDSSIVRTEASAADGSALVSDVSYNRAEDTFTVDGIGFDGANVYTRLPGEMGRMGREGRTGVFAAAATVTDPVSGRPVSQIPAYRALYRESEVMVDGEPRTSYAVVQTGGYLDYGYGGTVYQRKGGVVLPDSGQATFSGDYAGVRIFDNQTGLEYVTGDMTLDIDFDDFNANDAVRARLSNRVARRENGQPIPLGTGETDLKLPTVLMSIQEGAPSLDANGEIRGELKSVVRNAQGTLETYETGTFSGIVAGDATTTPGGEIVGIVVLESADPRFEGVNVRETGGVILNR